MLIKLAVLVGIIYCLYCLYCSYGKIKEKWVDYVLKPYIYNSPELYNKSKSVNEFYYEIPLEKNNNILVYRISFNL